MRWRSSRRTMGVTQQACMASQNGMPSHPKHLKELRKIVLFFLPDNVRLSTFNSCTFTEGLGILVRPLQGRVA